MRDAAFVATGVVVQDWHEEDGIDTANIRLVEKPRAGVDTEARWVKGGKCHFSYKRHTAVNQDGLVIAEETTPANECDMESCKSPEKVNLRQGMSVMVEKGYDSAENRKRHFPA